MTLGRPRFAINLFKTEKKKWSFPDSLVDPKILLVLGNKRTVPGSLFVFRFSDSFDTAWGLRSPLLRFHKVFTLGFGVQEDCELVSLHLKLFAAPAASSRFFYEASQARYPVCLTDFAMVSVTPPWRVTKWPCCTSLVVNKWSAAWYIGYTPTIRPLHSRIPRPHQS